MLKRVLATWPFLVRAMAFALGAFAIAWGVTGSAGLLASMIGAVSGSLLGHFLAKKTRWRLPVILVVTTVVTVVIWKLAGLGAQTTFVPRLLGPATSIVVLGVVRYGIVALGFVTALRVTAARKPSFVVLELLSVAVAIAIAFAAHRDGMLSRPLWLADWAWRRGIDPTTIFLAIGFIASGLLATVLLVEMKSKRSISSLLALAGIAALVILFIQAVGTPRPPPLTELPVNTEEGDEPIPPEAGANDEGGHGDAGANDGGEGEGGGDAEADGGAGGDGAADGGGGGGEAGDGGDLPDVDLHDLPPPKQPQDPKPDPNPRPQAIVILEDDYTPPQKGYYFRQEAMSQFNGHRLVPTGRSDADRDHLVGFPTEEANTIDPPPNGDERDAGAKDGGKKEAQPRQLVRTKIALLTPHPGPFALEGLVTLAPLPNPTPATFNRVYHANSLAQVADYDAFFGKKLGNPKWTPEQRAYYLMGPPDPRYKNLANELIAKANIKPELKNDMFAKAAAIKMGLDDMLTYTIKAAHSGPDPAGEMLFGNKIGYCVHFAHAAAFLWRSVGIPARVSAGYMVEEEDREGSAVAIFSNRGHMWPELYVEGAGWIILDISAKKNLDKGGPGKRAPRDLTKLLADLARQLPPDPAKVDSSETAPKTAKDIALMLLVWIAIGIGGVLMVLYGIKGWRRLAPSFTSAGSLPRVAYRTALDIVSEAGYARDFGETREGFALRVKKTAPSFEKLTALHLAARLRDPGMDRRARPEYSAEKWAKALSDLRAELTKKLGFWRRLLGRLHPISFFNSR